MQYEKSTLIKFGRSEFKKGLTIGLLANVPTIIGLIYVIQILVDFHL